MKTPDAAPPIRRISAADMRERFDAVIEELGDRPIAVVQDGRPRAYILSPGEYTRLTGHEDTQTAHATHELPTDHVNAIEKANADVLERS